MELLARFTALNEGLAERDRIEVKQFKVLDSIGKTHHNQLRHSCLRDLHGSTF